MDDRAPPARWTASEVLADGFATAFRRIVPLGVIALLVHGIELPARGIVGRMFESAQPAVERMRAGLSESVFEDYPARYWVGEAARVFLWRLAFGVAVFLVARSILRRTRGGIAPPAAQVTPKVAVPIAWLGLLAAISAGTNAWVGIASLDDLLERLHGGAREVEDWAESWFIVLRFLDAFLVPIVTAWAVPWMAGGGVSLPAAFVQASRELRGRRGRACGVVLLMVVLMNVAGNLARMVIAGEGLSQPIDPYRELAIVPVTALLSVLFGSVAASLRRVPDRHLGASDRRELEEVFE